MPFEREMEKLIQIMHSNGSLKTGKVEEAIRKIPRHLFVPEKYHSYAYIDEPLPVSHGQTISQPSVVARMTELLDVKEGQKILEVGAGSGWQAAILGHLVGGKGKVYSLDRIKWLVENARKNIKKTEIKNVEVIQRDGTLGLPGKIFDRIIVTAAAPDIPKPLKDHLKTNGKMVIPVGRFTQKMILLKKKKSGFVKKEEGFYRFVPLIGKYGFSD